MSTAVREKPYVTCEVLPAWEELATSIGLDLTPRVREVLERQVEVIIDYHARKGGPVMTVAPERGGWEWCTLRHILVKDLAADGMHEAESWEPPSGFECCTPGEWKVGKKALEVTRVWSASLGTGKVRATLTETVTVDGEISRSTPAIQMPRARFKFEQVSDVIADLLLAEALGVAL
ncbi:hypothetical protein [Prescottella agglutinans]|uniref:Phage protein n=1 Tax=Prescottella agglutinans TaxID=1644129 RepID=A0ABT6MGU5_9NOCA|nr:hypothetical protein [Prescottella agglutinans]MDH6283545.1 hypothetical protein [Prescottella agglutinans]